MNSTNVDLLALVFLLAGGFLLFFGLAGSVCNAMANECRATAPGYAVIAFQGLLLLIGMATFLLIDAPPRRRGKSYGS